MHASVTQVRDVPKTLQAAYNALRPGGLLIFSDRVFDARWDAYRAAVTAAVTAAGESAAPFWDTAHPCASKQTVVDHFLSAFEEIHASRYLKDEPRASSKRAISRREMARLIKKSRGDRDEQIYFIGRKPRGRTS